MRAVHGIDVLLSTFNGSRYVAAAIESILSQTYSDFKLHIVDDCSTDGTWAVISSFADPRIIRYKNSKNIGLFSNLNNLVSRTRAPWIKLMGQDDILTLDCLERGLSFAARYPTLGYFWCYPDYIDDAGLLKAKGPSDHTTGVLETGQADRDCLAWGCLSPNISNLFLRREALSQVGVFRCDIMSADFEMLSRIQGQFLVGRLTEKLVFVRSHDDQWSGDLGQMENHVMGNVMVFSQIYKRAVEECRSISAQSANDLLTTRLARNEFNWVLKALQKNRDISAACRSLMHIGSLVPLRTVAVRWGQQMLPRYIRRIASR